MDAVPKLAIEDLSYYYPETNTPALNRINLEIPEGQFLIIAGESGSGKSSLLRIISGLAPEFYGGSSQGRISLDDVDIKQLKQRELLQKMGIVFQNPESQLIMMSVEQELVFGLENLGLPNNLMRRRLMEVSGALGLSSYLDSFIPELSGGQKQKIALASVLAMQPEILLLDEPSSQLDPIAAQEFLAVVRQLNEDHGLTIILVEQRLERCCHLADRIIFMEQGQICYDYKVKERGANQWTYKLPAVFLPPIPKLFAGLGYKKLPMTVKQGRKILHEDFPSLAENKQVSVTVSKTSAGAEEQQNIVDIRSLYFSYPNGQEVLKNIDLSINSGDFIAVMGENGAGKSTLLKNINGLLKAGRGQIKMLNRDTGKMTVEELAADIGYLPQDSMDYLFLPSVGEELTYTIKNRNLPDDGFKEHISKKLNLKPFLECNPRDLSAGEAQRVVIASILLSRPSLLLLDEPTRGLDNHMKEKLGELLLQLNSEGTAIVMVTHDVEFVAQYARDLILMFGGIIVTKGSKYEILPQSTYYAPQMCKLFRNIADGVLKADEGKEILAQLIQYREEIM
ncbi:MAG: energy-coupling factor transporter ATPase [Syntrophomonadaceae bacterium]|nr:energy-coupling factor transporter ATPase [Syntrophomonadaceae bacterium]MDD3022319.1 energy-coupling factor transporter ATPase [Syntrophomonadaceae bacterium]